MKTLIVPTDFSAAAENAAIYATDLGKAIQADLLLLNVVQIPVTVVEVALTENEYEEMLQEAIKSLAELRAQLLVHAGTGKITIRTKVVVGTIEFELEQACKQEKPYLVIMGTKEAGSTERLLIGSNTLYAARNMHYPLFIIPQNMKYGGIHHIGLACDLETIYDVPVDKLQELSKLFEATLSIIHISKNKAEELASTAPLHLLSHRFKECKPELYYSINENIAQGIIDASDKLHLDMLIILNRKLDFFQKLFHKSSSKPLILHPVVPLVIMQSELV